MCMWGKFGRVKIFRNSDIFKLNLKTVNPAEYPTNSVDYKSLPI
jgi:hypothetical protein